MSEWIDLAEKPGVPTALKEQRAYYPSFSLDKTDLGDKMVGAEISIEAKCKIVSADISMGQKTRYRLEIHKIKFT